MRVAREEESRLASVIVVVGKVVEGINVDVWVTGSVIMVSVDGATVELGSLATIVVLSTLSVVAIIIEFSVEANVICSVDKVEGMVITIVSTCSVVNAPVVGSCELGVLAGKSAEV